MMPMRANIVGPPSVMNSFRKLGDVGAGVLQRDERRAAGKRDRFVECAFPTLAANVASPFCRIESNSLLKNSDQNTICATIESEAALS
jgi:hypothetical protein